MYILHGDQQVASRQKLIQLIEEAKANNVQLNRLEAETLSPGLLESLLGRTSLFGTQEYLVIENLHSLPPSKLRKNLIEQLANQTQRQELILWEKKPLTKTQLSKFAGAQIQEFKIKKMLFDWLDALIPAPQPSRLLKIFHQATAQEDVNFCFLMLIRQIRLLIQAKENKIPLVGSPFTISKINRQKQKFTLPKLLNLYQKLLKIDLAQKNGSAGLSLEQELDLWHLEL